MCFLTGVFFFQFLFFQLPPEYLKLLQEISLQQGAQIRASKPRRVQQQAPRQEQYKDVQPVQQQNVQYVNEEEYIKLLENQKLYNERYQQLAAQEQQQQGT